MAGEPPNSAENLEAVAKPPGVPHPFWVFLKEFASETDRAAVILGAAKVDDFLYHILIQVFHPHTGKVDDLLDSEGPLSTFSSRITVAFRLGLIDATFFQALNLIRRLRNEFAHSAIGMKLKDAPHSDRVR